MGSTHGPRGHTTRSTPEHRNCPQCRLRDNNENEKTAQQESGQGPRSVPAMEVHAPTKASSSRKIKKRQTLSWRTRGPGANLAGSRGSAFRGASPQQTRQHPSNPQGVLTSCAHTTRTHTSVPPPAGYSERQREGREKASAEILGRHRAVTDFSLRWCPARN